MIDIGSNVKAIRTQRSLTQVQLAKMTNYSPSYICDIERNNKVPTIDTLIRISNCLNVSISMLLDEGCCYDVLNNELNNDRGCININSKCKDCILFKNVLSNGEDLRNGE